MMRVTSMFMTRCRGNEHTCLLATQTWIKTFSSVACAGEEFRRQCQHFSRPRWPHFGQVVVLREGPWKRV